MSRLPDPGTVRHKAGFWAALLTVLLGAMDLTVIASIMTNAIDDLGINTADIDRYIWIVNAYLIAYVVSIPLIGRGADVFGLRRCYLASLLLFLIGSVTAALADSLELIVVARTIQGFGAGGLLPLTLSLAADTDDARQRLHGIGLVSAIETIGWVAGPAWGAIVVGVFGSTSHPWHWVFWLNIPFVLLAIVGILRYLPVDARGHGDVGWWDFDIPGALLLAGVLIALNLAFASSGEVGSQLTSGVRAFGGTHNPLADYVPVFAVAAVIGLMILVWQQCRARHPILPISLIRRRAYALALLANALVGAALMVAMVNTPVLVALMQDAEDVPRKSAIMLAPLTIGVALFALLTETFARPFGTRRVAMAGAIVAAIGFGLLYVVVDNTNVQMGMGLAIAGAGIGVTLAPLGYAAINVAAREQRGTAIATAIMMRLLGMTVGISLLTSAGVQRLQQLTDRLEPVVQQSGESTASYFVRQQTFVSDHVIPLSVQVLGETFLIAGVLAVIAVVPMAFMTARDR